MQRQKLSSMHLPHDIRIFNMPRAMVKKDQESRLTQSELKYLFNYDPITGFFTRFADPTSGGTMIVKRSGTINVAKYRVIMINYVQYLEHRLAFLYMTGSFPEDRVDHINGLKYDNRWCNLRTVGTIETSKDGAIVVDGVTIHLGSFDDANEKAMIHEAYSRVVFGMFYNLEPIDWTTKELDTAFEAWLVANPWQRDFLNEWKASRADKVAKHSAHLQVRRDNTCTKKAVEKRKVARKKKEANLTKEIQWHMIEKN